MLGYRFDTMAEKGMAFFQPSEPAGQFAKVVARLRRTTPELDQAIVGLEQLSADLNDHTGFMVKSVDEWEARLAKFYEAAEERPEWQLKVVAVNRPGDKQALTDRLYQAWLRIGLLGPVRNTFEMQCLNPKVIPAAELQAI
ncbi:MAG: hypothetical protein HY261_08005 [Chloroflexi bacterium]|nr:hypothetical protein [Chloroflexota bacterium]